MRALLAIVVVAALAWSGWWYFGAQTRKGALESWLDERRQAAHRHQLQIAHHLGLRQTEASGRLGDGDLAPLHQPREHHEQSS